jgi:hypothetical protein
MIPAFCLTRHDPAAGQYGDCVRACIASIMELPTGKVPHFIDTHGEIDISQLNLWFARRGYAPFWVAYPGEWTLDQLLSAQSTVNPGVHYVLFGGVSEGNHAVVCKGGAVVHNPAWYGGTLTGPVHDLNVWQIMAICKK